MFMNKTNIRDINGGISQNKQQNYTKLRPARKSDWIKGRKKRNTINKI